MPFQFPKPLPSLVIETVPDETGFTGCEKVALQNAVLIIRRTYRTHASQIFLDFFTEHEMLIERFRIQNDKFDMVSLHKHPKSVMLIYDRLITEGLDNVVQMNFILTDVAQCHQRYGVKKEEIRLLTEAVKDHLLRALNNLRSPTLDAAMEKMCETIVDFHANDTDEEAT